MKSPLPFLLLLLFFTSCSTVKKLITHTHAVTDSVSVSKKDSVSVNKTVSSKSAVSIQDLSIEISYPDSIQSEPTVYDSGTIGAIERVINKTRPKSITIRAGKIIDSSSVVATTDSVAVHNKDTVSVQKDITTNVRDVSKKHSPAWVTFAIIAVILGIIVFAVIKFNLLKLFGL